MPFDNAVVSDLILEMLVETRELISNGWIQGNYHDHNNSYCLVGALEHTSNRHANSPEDFDTKYRQAEKYIANEIKRSEEFTTAYDSSDYSTSEFTGEVSLMVWNDAAARTQAHVLEVLDKAIASRREKVHAV